ncbi:MAG TPA: hypothetical protein DDY91_18875 [Planctomycetaceae bacterium]|nr:hypothetical protein [Planctomycetaceae bacterium]
MRHSSIDLLRTLAIILMVLVHFVENLAGQQSRVWLPTGLAAPLFAFLSGFSHWLWRHSLESRRTSLSEISRRAVRRGLFLIGLGFAFNVLVWMPEDTFNWDVLTFLGFSLLILECLHDQPRFVWLVTAGGAYAIAPLLRKLADYDGYWTLGWFDPELTLSDTFMGCLATGYFPLCPWVVFPLVGYTVADLLAEHREQERPTLRRLGFLGGGLFLAGVLVAWWSSRLPSRLPNSLLRGWTMIPPSLEYVIGMLGLVLLSFSSSRRAIDLTSHRRLPPWLAQICTTFSRHSLSVYLLHHVAHLWPLWLIASFQGNDTTTLWQQATSPAIAILLAVGFLVTCYGALRWADETGLPTAESVLRWLCDSPP